MDPSLTASGARIQASEEPLGQNCWASGTLWDSGRRLEGIGSPKARQEGRGCYKPPICYAWAADMLDSA